MKKLVSLSVIIVVTIVCVYGQDSVFVINTKRIKPATVRFLIEIRTNSLVDSPGLKKNEHWIRSSVLHKVVDVDISKTPKISNADALLAFESPRSWIKAGELDDFTQTKSTYNHGSFPWVTVIETSPQYQYKYNQNSNPPGFEKRTILVIDAAFPAIYIIILWLCIISTIITYIVTFLRKTFVEFWSVRGQLTVVMFLFFCVACFWSGRWYFVFYPIVALIAYLFLPEIIGTYRDNARYYNLIFKVLFNVASALMLLFFLVHKDLYVFLTFIVTLFILVTPTSPIFKGPSQSGTSGIIVG